MDSEKKESIQKKYTLILAKIPNEATAQEIEESIKTSKFNCESVTDVRNTNQEGL